MKRVVLYGFLSLVLVAGFTACSRKYHVPSLKETYNKSDKNPFGIYTAFELTKQFYSQKSIYTRVDNFNNIYNQIDDTDALYISITDNFLLSDMDLESMLRFVARGNTVFISSNNIDERLLDTLQCSVKTSDIPYTFIPSFLEDTRVKLANEVFRDTTTEYGYFYYPLNNRFIKSPVKASTNLGKNQTHGVNFLAVYWGDGKFLLHTEPRCFSNYFLLQKDNYKYLSDILKLTSEVPEQIFWDDFYRKKNDRFSDGENKGGLSFLLKYPSLSWAFWLTIALLMIYVLFGGKRRQRIIAETVPKTNTTVVFAETIGRLYLQKKDNKNLSDKIITYFFEQIRTQYYLNTSHINDDLTANVSRKSGVPLGKTSQLFSLINLIQSSTEVSDEQLLSLNQLISLFNKNKI